ncbi:MAG TPA: hypothetical protein VFT54_10365 [Acidimicrobiia bacterium]|nr:hypothetical protein [Acidimicrobiia bacterium]
MPSKLHRPPAPETPDFWDRLEAELRRRIISDPHRPRSRTHGIVRILRPFARPALHGSMAVVAMLMVGALGLPGRNAVSVIESRDVTRFTEWVPVVEVEDPRAPVVFYALIDRVPRFITFIESQPGESVPEAQDLLAV